MRKEIENWVARVLTFLVGVVIAGIGIIVWINQEMESAQIWFVAITVPVGIWFCISALLPAKNSNHKAASFISTTTLYQLPLLLVAAIWGLFT